MPAAWDARGAGGSRRRLGGWEENDPRPKTPFNKYAIEDLSCSWATSLKNSLGAVFQLGFNKEFDILVEFGN